VGCTSSHPRCGLSSLLLHFLSSSCSCRLQAVALHSSFKVDYTARPTLEFVVSLALHLISIRDYKQEHWKVVSGSRAAGGLV
jgi:hypothetical protein